MRNAKEPVYSRSYGKEDMVKETQEGCLSRPIRKNLNFFESSDFQADWQKYFFDSLCARVHIAHGRVFRLVYLSCNISAHMIKYTERILWGK